MPTRAAALIKAVEDGKIAVSVAADLPRQNALAPWSASREDGQKPGGVPIDTQDSPEALSLACAEATGNWQISCRFQHPLPRVRGGNASAVARPPALRRPFPADAVLQGRPKSGRPV
jgi:hypothetical protein